MVHCQHDATMSYCVSLNIFAINSIAFDVTCRGRRQLSFLKTDDCWGAPANS